jgi:hypothetical protein
LWEYHYSIVHIPHDEKLLAGLTVAGEDLMPLILFVADNYEAQDGTDLVSYCCPSDLLPEPSNAGEHIGSDGQLHDGYYVL